MEVVVDVDAALEMQLAAYRRMTGEERLAIALRLHELTCDLARKEFRHQHPQATPVEVEERLRQRLRLARGL